MEPSVQRLTILGSGFQGSDLLIRKGSQNFGLLREGKEIVIHIPDGESCTVRRLGTQTRLFGAGGGALAEFDLHKGITFQGKSQKVGLHPYRLRSYILEDEKGTIAIFTQEDITLYRQDLHPALVVFLAYIFRENREKFSEAGWVTQI